MAKVSSLSITRTLTVSAKSRILLSSISNTFWRLLQSWGRRIPRFFVKSWLKTDASMVDNMIEHALVPSDKRDTRALVWTVGSLSDNQEVQRFVEAESVEEQGRIWDAHLKPVLLAPWITRLFFANP